MSTDVIGEHGVVFFEDSENIFVFGSDFFRGQDVNGLEDFLIFLVVFELDRELIVFFQDFFPDGLEHDLLLGLVPYQELPVVVCQNLGLVFFVLQQEGDMV